MSDKNSEATNKAGGLFGSLSGFIESIGNLADAAEQHKRGGAKETGSAGGKTAAENKVGGILNGLAELAEKLKSISENGQSVSEKGEFTFPSKAGGVKGVYGFTMKTGLGEKGDQIKVETFGNIRKDQKTGEAVVHEINEPQVDVFEDEGGTTLIAEMPGVGPEDLERLRLAVGDTVEIEGKRKAVRGLPIIFLPGTCRGNT